MSIRNAGFRGSALFVTLLAAGPHVLAADAVAGKAAFRQQCVLCHTAEPSDNGGAQGPSLAGVVGRKAGGVPGFSYTEAMKKSNLTWDASTLDRFLQAPTTVVPGSSMVVPVTDKVTRENVIAYLQVAPTSVQAAATGGSAAGDADWKKDAPGRLHKIDPAALAKPMASSLARNTPKMVDKPAGAKLSVPPGFKVEVYASGLNGPRRLLSAANGDVFVTETQAGRITLLHPSADGASSSRSEVFVEGLRQPFGLALYPDAQQPKWLYVAETNRVVRYAYKTGDTKPSADPEVVVPELASGSGHSTRDIAFSPDGKRLFVSVGSQSNFAEDMPKKSPAEVKAWEAQHGFGTSWDKETDRAVVLVFDATTPGKAGKVFASGIRNCVGLATQPKTGDLWCTTNERDMLGDDLVPDYSTRVKEGGFYGWPWYYIGANEDPRLKGDRPDLRDKVIVPDVLFQAHSAALNLTFYPGSKGKSAFPAEYAGEAFAVFHGSWNRNFRTGHKVVRVKMKNGVPTGEYEDFLTGFIVDDGNAWGRPVATTVLNDGSLLLSDDKGNTVFRVSYSGAP